MNSMNAGISGRTPGAIEVGAGLVVDGGRVLLSRRSAGTHLAGLWEFPGGKREKGETWEACVARELLEELGIKVRVGALYWEVVHRYPEKAVWLRFFRATRERGAPQPLQCAAVAWVAREALAGYEFPAADAELIERLIKDDSFWRA